MKWRELLSLAPPHRHYLHTYLDYYWIGPAAMRPGMSYVTHSPSEYPLILLYCHIVGHIGVHSF